MEPRIVIVGGGSNQWVPKVLVDMVNTPSLGGAEIVLEDINDANLPRMQRFVEHCAAIRGIPMTCRTTTDQRDALAGADFVVVSISTGGFDSMAFDLEIPASRGLVQTVGDTVGPGGIMRGLRNVPVLVGIARDMEALCPDAWLLNLTNPMTTLTRAVTKATAIKAVGVCHESVLTTFVLSLLLGRSFLDIDLTVGGVNHLPWVTKVDVGGDDGLALLRDLMDDPSRRAEELPFGLPRGLGMAPRPTDGPWTIGELLDVNQVKLELLRTCGALPAAGDRHLVEFFPWFCRDVDSLKQWGVVPTTIDERRAHEQRYSDALDALLAKDEVSRWPSGETLAAVIDSLVTGTPRTVVLNLPNTTQLPALAADVVVESTCIVDGHGIRPRDVVDLPPVAAEHTRRVAASQEMVVRAGMEGGTDLVLEAMLADPLTGRLDLRTIGQMADEMLAASRPWLRKTTNWRQ